MNRIISKGTNTYHMSIIFDKTTQSYLLVFSSTKDNHGEQYTCESFSDALNRFNNNCRFYGVPEAAPLTEEEFLGINPGAIWPTPKKEVVYAKDRA